MKLNCKDLMFLIPVHIDSIERIENILAICKNISRLDTRILICEVNYFNNHILEKLIAKEHSISYVFFEDRDPIFHRTRYINEAVKYINTPFVAIWDSDVVVDNIQITNSLEALRNNNYDISFPFDGDFFDVDKIFREQFLKTNNIKLLKSYKRYLKLLYGKNFVGGGILVNKERYIDGGLENERFYGWGPEDLDRFKKWKHLGYNIHRSEGCMFHLWHPRDENGMFRSNLQRSLCNMYLNDTMYSSKNELTKQLR